MEFTTHVIVVDYYDNSHSVQGQFSAFSHADGFAESLTRGNGGGPREFSRVRCLNVA